MKGTPKEEKRTAIGKIILEINKKYGPNTINYVDKMENVAIKRVASGIPKLDEAIGGGFPLGRIVEFYGLFSSGKSLIAQKIVTQAQKEGLETIWIDAENSFDPIFAQSLGVDINKVVLMQVGVGEDIIDMLCQILKAEPGVIVIDSVAALITRGELEESIEKAFMAPRARLMSKTLAKINTLNSKTLIIFINQLRQNIGGYHPFTAPTGGMALSFYASLRIEVKKENELLYEDGKKSGKVIGQIIQFRVTKNKIGQAFKSGSFKFFFENSKLV